MMFCLVALDFVLGLIICVLVEVSWDAANHHDYRDKPAQPQGHLRMCTSTWENIHQGRLRTQTSTWENIHQGHPRTWISTWENIHQGHLRTWTLTWENIHQGNWGHEHLHGKIYVRLGSFEDIKNLHGKIHFKMIWRHI